MVKNTSTRFGAVARFFHWAIALLIFTAIGLGLYGESQPRNADTVETLRTIYSLHKTIGITVLILAVLRIVWATLNPRPAPLHPDRKAETFAAEFVHWALYGALIVMPLSGWVLHASEAGFAPIWWPFGQGLPFVPKSESVVHTAAAIHGLSAWVIYLTVGLHVAGALKHAIIDRDGTLTRMLRGESAGRADPHPHYRTAFVAAIILWLAVVIPNVLPGAGGVSASMPADEPIASASSQTAPVAEQGADAWTVTEGVLGFAVAQMGSAVEGHFGSWAADITYDADTGEGSLRVAVDTTSLDLGSVTQQAKGPEFFDTETYATAIYQAEINRVGEGPEHEAPGHLTLAGATVPANLSFVLSIEEDVAQAQGTLTLDRRDFGMGEGYEDESTVGFGVDVHFEVTAARVD